MGKSRNSISIREVEKKLRGPYRKNWEMWHENSKDKRLPPKSTRFILEEEMDEDERAELVEDEGETEIPAYVSKED